MSLFCFDECVYRPWSRLGIKKIVDAKSGVQRRRFQISVNNDFILSAISLVFFFFFRLCHYQNSVTVVQRSLSSSRRVFSSPFLKQNFFLQSFHLVFLSLLSFNFQQQLPLSKFLSKKQTVPL